MDAGCFDLGQQDVEAFAEALGDLRFWEREAGVDADSDAG